MIPAEQADSTGRACPLNSSGGAYTGSSAPPSDTAKNKKIIPILSESPSCSVMLLWCRCLQLVVLMDDAIVSEVDALPLSNAFDCACFSPRNRSMDGSQSQVVSFLEELKPGITETPPTSKTPSTGGGGLQWTVALTDYIDRTAVWAACYNSITPRLLSRPWQQSPVRRQQSS